MDAIVTAGGIPLPEEPLYPATQGESKALVDVAGKPMIQWVFEAASRAENAVVAGHKKRRNVESRGICRIGMNNARVGIGHGHRGPKDRGLGGVGHSSVDCACA